MKVLVTGAAGQLGASIQQLVQDRNIDGFTFVSKIDLDITDYNKVKLLLQNGLFNAVVNCAAYTAVDKAEQDVELCHKINVTGAEVIAKACNELQILLIHISTDFVFEGNVCAPRLEDDTTNPISVYGKSKLEGERKVLAQLSNAIIIRTGWLYSAIGNNFFRTILRLASERPALRIIYDQTGTPTYALDLADTILHILLNSDWQPGIYHYSNEGVASWYDFAVAIVRLAGKNVLIAPIRTNEYPTAAARPAYSVLDKNKIKLAFNIAIPHWQSSLEACIKKLNS